MLAPLLLSLAIVGAADTIPSGWTAADAEFMAGMIPHHAQAIRMARWAEPNGASREVQVLAARIINAQQDEIAMMETWLRDRPKDPLLLSVLGRLCAQAELWGQAQKYLEASLALGESRTAHLELARLLERLGRPEAAAGHYRRAAEGP